MHCLRHLIKKKNYEKLIEESPNYGFYKTFLIQESRYFNSSSINPRKCIKILINLLYLLNQGEEMTAQESTETFFAITKLFQSENKYLRRLMYLCIKELSPSVPEAFIVISSVIKDMSANEDLYRAAAIRALFKISANVNGDVLLTIERYMKQAILDENPAVKSAALVSTFHLTKTAPELARRWVNEAQGVIISDSAMVSYHAFAVVAALRNKSHISIVRLIAKYAHSSLQSPLALSLLIRYAAKLVQENPSETIEHYCTQLIRNSLRHKSDIVVYEAAYAVICLNKNNRDLCQAITDIRLRFCNCPQATYRLAGVRALSRVITMNHPFITIATTLEHLISDQNKYVAVNAFITLMTKSFSKIEDQQSIDHVLKIAGKMTELFLEISDELKITIVNAVRICYLKYPEKSSVVVSFFGLYLKTSGGLPYKTALVDAMTDFAEKYCDVTELALGYLSEFIEDCEYAALSIRILQVLGNQGPKVSNPCKYMRCIYNRIILNSSPIRAAAVRALARFGAARPELLTDVVTLLSHCQRDENNEVRDRAIFYTALLNSGDSDLIQRYIVSVTVNVKSICEYLVNTDATMDMETILKQEVVNKPAINTEDKKDATCIDDQYALLLNIDPEISNLGLPFKICEPENLTEPDVEYPIICTKYIFAEHLILQFECLNTLSDQLLEQVHIRLESHADFEIVASASCDHLEYDTQGYVLCILKFPLNAKDTVSPIDVILEFVVHNYDPNTKVLDSGHIETYLVENVIISCMDQLQIYEADDNWEASWAKATQDCELCDTFVVGPRSIDDAIKEVCLYLGLPETVIEINGNKAVRASCLWRSGVSVLLRAQFMTFKDEIVTMQVAIRSTGKEIAALILSSVGRSVCLAK